MHIVVEIELPNQKTHEHPTSKRTGITRMQALLYRLPRGRGRCQSSLVWSSHYPRHLLSSIVFSTSIHILICLEVVPGVRSQINPAFWKVNWDLQVIPK